MKRTRQLSCSRELLRLYRHLWGDVRAGHGRTLGVTWLERSDHPTAFWRPAPLARHDCDVGNSRPSGSELGTTYVQKSKRPYGVVSSWEAYIIGSDEHGLWLHSPKDSIHHLRSGEEWVVPWNGVQLLPKHEPWWVAWFWDRPGSRWTAADVCTPVTWEDRGWSYVDLELDPVGNPDGFDHLADEDEFRVAVDAGHIDHMEEHMALAAAREVQELMASGREPFGRAGWLALDLVADLGLPPTT